MKRIFNVLFIFCALGLTNINAQINTPAASPSAKVSQDVGLSTVTIEYSRPSKKDRKLFGADGLVPNGSWWRTGANSATKITFSDDTNVEGKEVKAGSYAILTKPEGMKWTVNFYPYTGSSWGSYREATPAASVMVNASKVPLEMETFTIMVGNLTMDGGTLGMMWGDMYVPVKLTTAVDKQVMANIDRVLAGPSAGDYYTAANYYHSAGKDLNKALMWIQKATKVDNPRFWQVRREALILADLGRYQEAIKAAQLSHDLAEKAGNADYVKMNKDSIAMWSKK